MAAFCRHDKKTFGFNIKGNFLINCRATSCPRNCINEWGSLRLTKGDNSLYKIQLDLLFVGLDTLNAGFFSCRSVRGPIQCSVQEDMKSRLQHPLSRVFNPSAGEYRPTSIVETIGFEINKS